MPRRVTPLFKHEVHYAPDVLDNHQQYSARVQKVDMVGGKVRVRWNIYTSFKKKRRRKPKPPQVAP